ncbi:hypothetical protein EOD39_22093 [Acipenser ruthenus]|uniref:Uncharacterized protein n=1 Tax=Acipenser ruthenus TaxID=7906 RepID=A0A444UQV0_ACIRT|nr:hypothetical protein EOD39_22093 [Acipenser ruthenus]
MSNAESEGSEQEAHKIIKRIPGVNLIYKATRSVVNAAKGDRSEVTKHGIAVAKGLAGPVGGMLAGPVGGMLATAGVAALDDALKNKD